MLLKQIIDVFELLDDSRVDGAAVVDFLKAIDPEVDAETYPLTGPRGTTHMVRSAFRAPGEKARAALCRPWASWAVWAGWAPGRR